ncbi:NAD(P)-dependent oxidoreductase [Crossiella sp. CA-258035]|uniref:NAD(P)-dependent oxidoreductase n=1 Tax=Crossiella sp. CA-258035 TaxID=2981138 RepID=UPI0024BC3E86|nr:NAD(P)-dependent oxidoreductase [Crossiella sp. CA-258035]WHT21981.1 NAD(P)-dependent oxidoreductase [Crossiella sp. CA-258035]
MNTRIAFLGLGTMGLPMARRLLAAGYPLTVWNRSPERATALAARVASTPAEAAREAEVVVTMLADPAAVLSVVAELDLRPGSTLIEMSTIGPDALREVAALLPAGVTLIDAPVMGSADKAAAGELTLLVGGPAEPVLPVLEVFGKVVRTGLTGTGAALKLVLINATVTGVVAIAEALTLAEAFGLPAELVREALAGSALGGLAARAFATGAHYPIRLAAKDSRLAAEAAELPLAALVAQRLAECPAAEEDLGQIVRQLRAR